MQQESTSLMVKGDFYLIVPKKTSEGMVYYTEVAREAVKFTTGADGRLQPIPVIPGKEAVIQELGEAIRKHYQQGM